MIRSHFTDESKLQQQFAALRDAAEGVAESTRKLDDELNQGRGEEDQFGFFAERARRSKF